MIASPALSAEIEEGLPIVEKQLQGRTLRTGEEELFKARSRDQGSVKIIDIVRARLDTRSDSYAAEVPSLAIKDAQIDDELVRANERMLTDGFYAEVSLEYDPVIAQERNGRQFRIAGLRPIQMSNPNVLAILAKGLAAFTTEEWRDFLFQQISPYSHLISGGDIDRPVGFYQALKIGIQTNIGNGSKHVRQIATWWAQERSGKDRRHVS